MNNENYFILITAILVGIFLQTSAILYFLLRKNLSFRRKLTVYLDSSVLMDGRILDLAQTGFIPGSLVVPRSVIGEMQFLADNGDADKRERARRGLDVVSELQAQELINIRIEHDSEWAKEGVDNRLLKLAKKNNGLLCTIDYNLNKVAKVQGVQVLNINELARVLRMSYLPGEELNLDLTTRGTDSHQAVGHLSDGTMVVVEKAATFIGKNVKIVIIRSMQTNAGKMMFAKLADQTSKTTGKRGESKNNRNSIKTRTADSKKSIGRRPSSSRSTGVAHPRGYRQTGEDNLIALVDRQIKEKDS